MFNKINKDWNTHYYFILFCDRFSLWNRFSYPSRQQKQQELIRAAITEIIHFMENLYVYLRVEVTFLKILDGCSTRKLILQNIFQLRKVIVMSNFSSMKPNNSNYVIPSIIMPLGANRFIRKVLDRWNCYVKLSVCESFLMKIYSDGTSIWLYLWYVSCCCKPEADWNMSSYKPKNKNIDLVGTTGK